MARPFTFADREPPAEIRQHHPLFAWAADQAAAAKELDAKIAAARERHERTVTVLHESMEFREVEAARERVRDAKKAAVEDDPAVAKAADALKKARAALKKSAREVVNAEKSARLDVKILVQTKDETERGIVGALKSGKVPDPMGFKIPGSTDTDAQRLARDPKFMRAMDKLAGTVEKGGSITIEAGGQSVVIDHEAAQRIHANAVAAGAVKK